MIQAAYRSVGLVVVAVCLAACGPSPNMSFFVTSRPAGDGGNLGGLAGADAHCAALAAASGSHTRTWRAYLSTQGHALVGHSNKAGAIGDARAKSWNSAHLSDGCTVAALQRLGSAGLLYCFALD